MKKVFLIFTTILVVSLSLVTFTSCDKEEIKENIKEIADEFKPTVVTKDVTDITTTSATCGGIITENPNEARILSRGVLFSTDIDKDLKLPSYSENALDSLTNLGLLARSKDDTDDFNVSINVLIPNTEYIIRAYTITVYGNSYGEIMYFKTKSLLD